MYARNRIPMYEGDGIIRQASPADTLTESPERLPEPPREKVEGRIRPLSRGLGKLLAWVGRRLQFNSALEDYLSRASNLAEVERLLRKAERDGHFFQH
jgi:hypothetical protein